jgi:hypothetical protein
MTTGNKSQARGIRAVRVSEEESILAEALARMEPGPNGFSEGVRMALRWAEDYYREYGHGERLDRYRRHIAEQRAADRAQRASDQGPEGSR